MLSLLLAALVRLSTAEAHGKQIYVRGESPRGTKITASLGPEALDAPGSIVPCASCHGYDGRGRGEGGVEPANIRWDVLTRPYSLPDARQHPPYTKSSLRRAVTMGVDPAGNALQATMPRYRMSMEDMEELLAYLQRLPDDVDPGLSDAAVRVGVLLPARSPRAARAAVDDYFKRLNAGGGVYGRKVEPRYAAGAGALPGDVFAVVAGSIVGDEEAVDGAAERNQIPTIATIASREPEGRYAFHVVAGIREQAIALAKLAGGARIAAAEGSPWKELAAAVRSEVPEGAGAILVLGPETLQRQTIRTAAAAAPPPPWVLIPGSIAALDPATIPPALDGRVAIAMPLPPGGVAPSVTGTLTAARLFVEALRRTGRDTSREKLVDALEAFDHVDAGIAPKVTFAPERHTGTGEAYVMLFDAAARTFVPRR